MVHAPLNLLLNLIGRTAFTILAHGELQKHLDVWAPLHVLIAAFLGYHAFNIIVMVAQIPATLTYNAIQNHIQHRIEDQVERFLQSEEWLPSITAEGETRSLDTYAADEAVSSTQNYAKAFERLLYVRITIDTLTAIAVIGAALYLLLRA